MTGPFETEREALSLPAVRAAYAAITGPGTGTPECLAILEDALGAAGVELGAYDQRIVNWLAGWEAQACAVIAGLITRAAGPGAGQLAAIRAVLARFDWEQDDRQYALEEIDRIAGGTS